MRREANRHRNDHDDDHHDEPYDGRREHHDDHDNAHCDDRRRDARADDDRRTSYGATRARRTVGWWRREAERHDGPGELRRRNVLVGSEEEVSA